MNALSAMIAAAVTEAVSANAKLFDPKKIERAPDALTKSVVKFLTRETKEGETEAPAEETAPYELVPVDDARAKAFLSVRTVADCLGRPQVSGEAVYIKRAALCPSVLPFADLPKQPWKPVTSVAQLSAWREFFDRVLPDIARRSMGDSMALPWPWPPSKEGKVYEAEAQEEMLT